MDSEYGTSNICTVYLGKWEFSATYMEFQKNGTWFWTTPISLRCNHANIVAYREMLIDQD